MLYFLLCLSTATATAKSVIFKKVGVNIQSPKMLTASNSISFLTAALVALIFGGFNFSALFNISSYSLVLSLFFAISLVTTYLAQIRAMSLANASTTSLIYSCGFLIPIFFSYFAYNETVSLVQIISILFLILSLVLIINPQKSEKISLKWVLLSVLSACGSGTTAVLQKVHQRSLFASEFPSLLTFAFTFAAAFLFVVSLFINREESEPKLSKRNALTSVLSGTFVGALNMLNISLAGKIPAVILFPIYNIGSTILSSVICAIMFKEKTNRRQIIGVCIGLVAILFIGIF